MKVKIFKKNDIESLEAIINGYVLSIPDHEIYRVLYSTVYHEGIDKIIYSVVICHRERDRNE